MTGESTVYDPTDDRPVQNQEWNGERIRQALVVGSAATSAAQARKESQRARGTLFHEYCCGPHSPMGKEASERGYQTQRWGEFNVDLYTSEGMETPCQHILPISTVRPSCTTLVFATMFLLVYMASYVLTNFGVHAEVE